MKMNAYNMAITTTSWNKKLVTFPPYFPLSFDKPTIVARTRHGLEGDTS